MLLHVAISQAVVPASGGPGDAKLVALCSEGAGDTKLVAQSGEASNKPAAMVPPHDHSCRLCGKAIRPGNAEGRWGRTEAATVDSEWYA